MSFDNFRAASVDTDRRSVRLTHRNLLGYGDRFSIGYLNVDLNTEEDSLQSEGVYFSLELKPF